MYIIKENGMLKKAKSCELQVAGYEERSGWPGFDGGSEVERINHGNTRIITD